MGATIAEKVIARAAGVKNVTSGQYIDVIPDHVVMHELFWPIYRRHLNDLGLDDFVNHNRPIIVIDHTIQGASGAYDWIHDDLRKFVTKIGFKNFYDVGRGGLRHQVMVERGYARPGMLIFSDEGNLASMGVFGALNVYVSWEVFVFLVRNQNWMRVPETVRINLEGDLPFGAHVRDLLQAILRDYSGTDAFLQKCLEFHGGAIRKLSLDDRQGLLAGVYNAGADTAIMEVEERALAYVEARSNGLPFEIMNADPDANYINTLEYDLSTLEPFVTLPPNHGNVVPVSDVSGMPITQATVGSCGSNRFDDLQATADILKGRQVAKGVVMYISPGSPEIYARAAEEGLLTIFAESGATVLAPGCNTCWGYIGVLKDGEVAISSQQKNYRGRQGSEKAEIYLASPYVVAASAVSGCITDPRDFLSETTWMRRREKEAHEL